jgi:transposase
MRKVIKQVVGIDVAQKELVVTLGKMQDDLVINLTAYNLFKNTSKGFEALIVWTKKLTDAQVDLRFVMESTGIYHEKFAYFLVEQGFNISIILPNKISSYMRTLDVKTVTDKTASQAIAQFGLERKLDNWSRPNPILKSLKQLTRERDQLVDERSVIKNQIHAEKSEAEPNSSSLIRMDKRIKMLNKQEIEIKKEINDLINSDAKLKEYIECATTIPGIGTLTAAIIFAETNGFELIRSKRQLTSFAGLDVKEKQSGTSVKGKPRISKKGNRHLRKAMHLPALTAIRRDENYKILFARLVAKHGIKMKAVTAVQRKLLELTYILYKNKTTYDKAYKVKEDNPIIELPSNEAVL